MSPLPFDPGTPDALEQETSIADTGIQRDTEPQGAAASAIPLGFILDEPDEEKVAKHVVKLWEDQSPQRSRHRAVWKRNRWWREGRRFVRLEKKENQALWEAKLPYGMGSAPPVPNKTDRLCRRVVNTYLVDKPFPDCEPGDDSSEAREAAEFSTRYLSQLGSPAQLNMSRILRASADKKMTYASTFGWVIMNPNAGGHRPRRMLAHPQAQTTQDALTDPATGLQADEATLTERYVTPDQALTDDPTAADLQWMPAPRVRLLTGLQVTLLPETARGMDDATGVLIVDTTTLGDLKQQFPDTVGSLSKDDIAALVAWKPDPIEDVLPAYGKEPEEQKDEDGNYKDSQMVIVSTVYYESSAEYPFGCYAVIGGNCKVLHRQKWSAMMPVPPGPNGEELPPKEECLEIPVAQDRCLDDDTTDDPYGVGLVEHFGPADEIRASAIGFELEHMFRAANPIPFLPIGSIVQPNQFLLRDGKPVFTNPQGKPEWENVPALSSTVPELREEMGHEMDDESGLQQAAQGVEDTSVNSGIHAQTIVQEALKALTSIKDNTGDFYIALNRIILQLSRAFCTVPQMLSYVGEDGEYKAQEWSRTDFRNTKVVSIAKGSYTMHTLASKMQMADGLRAQQVIDADDYTDLLSSGTSAIIGMQDNPHLMRVRRQLTAWKKGPPQGWVEAFNAYTQQMQAMQQQAALAQQPPAIPGQPPQTPPAPASPAPQPPPHPFSDRLPVDLEPMPGKIRHRQMSRVMAESKFTAMDPAWRQIFLTEFLDMKNAAGVMTVAEVQAAQAQAEAQKAAAEGQAMELKKAELQQQASHQAQELALKYAPKPEAPPQQPPVVNVHLPAEGPKDVMHVRDETGRIVGSRVTPQPA